MTTAPTSATVIGGVDTHKHTHYPAAIDDQGRLLGHREFPANDGGYQHLLGWMRSQGQVLAIGVESTGSFGATLTKALTKAGEQVIEVNRPKRVGQAHGRQVRPARRRTDRPRGARTNLDRDPEDQVRDGRGDPHAASDPGECGVGPHAGVQHAVGSHDWRPFTTA
jgi:hypothetical protein